ncbi:MAG: threonylcarbamoyl-AMP synthase [Agarilytica sp.]
MFPIKLQRCVEALAQGEVIAYPTEAVWGLGCDPFNHQAVSKILALKSRPEKKGLILVAAKIAHFEFLLDGLQPDRREMLEMSWPGHTTWLVPHKHRVPHILSGQHDTIALRVSEHPIIQGLCNYFGGPIVSTSANPQGLRPATSQFKARHYFAKKRVIFAPGQVGAASKPSKIVDLTTGTVIR